MERYLPDSPGGRNRSLFALARYLKGKQPNATQSDLRAVVSEWHRLALPVIGTAEFSVSWGDFMRGWGAVRVPFGSVLNNLLMEIDMTAELPSGLLALGYQEKGYLLIRICKQLQRNAGDGVFFLSARQAGELIGACHTDAAKMLYALVTDGVLELVTRGAGKMASRYRYVWPDEAAGDPANHRRCADAEAA